VSYPVLILGLSGSGKSSSIRTLPPDKTFLFNVCGKELPFRESRSMYQMLIAGKGNMVNTDDYDVIEKTLQYLEKSRTEVKYIIIDDSQYLLVNEFMRKHSSQGKGNDVFSLYNQIGDHFWNLLWSTKFSKQNIFIFFLHHAEMTDTGFFKAKSIGKMLDDKVDIPGMFTFVLLAKRDGPDNYFLTQNDGTHPAKTPMGMFDSVKIPNDLFMVANTIENYYKGE